MKKSINKLFPLSSKYDNKWIKLNSLGENVLYNLESLSGILKFNYGERVLDLGCGKAVSSIFMAKEFNVKVWAVDLTMDVTENMKRIKQQNCEDMVFPMQLNSRELPFPDEYFDVIICVDSYLYFGTDEKFVPYITKFLRPGGQIGIVDICFSEDINYIAEAPDFIKNDFAQKWYFVHSIKWWKKMWEKTGLLKVKKAGVVPYNKFIKDEYVKDSKSKKGSDYFAEALSKDKEGFLNIFRMTAQKADIKLNL